MTERTHFFSPVMP